MTERIAPRSIAAFILVSLIWGSTWLVIRTQIALVPPGWSVTLRFALAALGLMLLARLRGERLALDRRAQGFAILLGISQFVGNFHFVYQAETLLTSGLVAVLYALLMLPNALLARLFLKTPVTPRFLVGTGIALVGIACLFVQEYRAAPAGAAGHVIAGVLFSLAGLMCASISNVLQAGGPARRTPVIPLLAWAMLWGTLVNVAIALAGEGVPRLPADPWYYAGLAYLAIIGSVVTFPLYFGLIRDIGAGRAAFSGVLVPVIAMALSTIFEGYRWSPLAIVGGALAMVGLVVAMQARSPARKSG